MKRPNNSKSGFSLIDVIMGMSILAIAIIGIQVAQNNYMRMSSQVEANLRAISLGNSVMNLIRMHRFDENITAPWDSTLGINAGETSAAYYDDIDDYDGTSWDFSGDGYAGYEVQTQVFCVNMASSWVNEVGGFTSFKRIIVSVNHAVLDDPVVFTSLMAGIEE
ncbi:MAG: hypothetical protein K9N29_11640 [Candidatus Marinimicrobia bacterium]|nr:hypothetical protein [Candidatus Neomarinimicrobiota bacterium]